MPNTITLVAKLRDELSGPLQNTGNQTQSFGDKLSGMGAKAGIAAAAITAVVAAVGKFADSMADIRDASAALGVSTDTVQGLGYAFRQTGGNSDTFANSMRGLTNFMRTAAQGGAAQAAILEEMGFTYEQLAAMSPEEQYLAITDALGEMTDEQARAEAGAALFGARYSQQIIGTLEQTGGTLRDVNEEFQKSDMAIPEESIMAAAAFSDTMEDMKTQMTAVMAEALMPLMPVLSELIAWFGSLMSSLAPLIAALLDVITPVMELSAAIWSALMPVIDALVAILTPLVNIISTQLTTSLAPVTEAFVFLGEMISTLLAPILESLIPIFDSLMAQAEGTQEMMNSLAEAVEPLQEIYLLLATVLGETLAAAFEIIGPILNIVLDLFMSLAETVLPLVVGGIGVLVDILEITLVPILEGLQWVINATLDAMRLLGLIEEEAAESSDELAESSDELVEGLEDVEVAADNATDAVEELQNAIEDLDKNLADLSTEELELMLAELARVSREGDEYAVGVSILLSDEIAALLEAKYANEAYVESLEGMTEAERARELAVLRVNYEMEKNLGATEEGLTLIQQRINAIEALTAAEEEGRRSRETETPAEEVVDDTAGEKLTAGRDLKQLIASLRAETDAWNASQLEGEAAITDAYNRRMLELQKLRALGGEVGSIEEAEFQANVDREEALMELRRAAAEERLEQTQEYASAAANIFSGLADLQSALLDRQREKEIERVEAGVGSEESKRARIEAINKKYDEKEKKAAALKKVIKVAQAISNVALGVTQALSHQDYVGAGIIAALGAIEVATIMAQPYAKGGWVEGVGTGDTVPALLTPGEYVIPRDQAQKMVAGGFILPREGVAIKGATGGTTVFVTMSSVISTASKAEMMRAADVIQKSLKERGIALG